jgi:predicted transcriptional regulator
MENLGEEELKILIAVARSDNSECDVDTLVRTLNMPEKDVQYYVYLLAFDKEYLFWVNITDLNEPDRYSLTDNGRQFLLEGSFI